MLTKIQKRVPGKGIMFKGVEVGVIMAPWRVRKAKRSFTVVDEGENVRRAQRGWQGQIRLRIFSIIEAWHLQINKKKTQDYLKAFSSTVWIGRVRLTSGFVYHDTCLRLVKRFLNHHFTHTSEVTPKSPYMK